MVYKIIKDINERRYDMERRIKAEFALLKKSVRTYREAMADCPPEEVLAEALIRVGISRAAGNRRLACATPLNRVQTRLEEKIKHRFTEQELAQLLAYFVEDTPFEIDSMLAFFQLVPDLRYLTFRNRLSISNEPGKE